MTVTLGGGGRAASVNVKRKKKKKDVLLSREGSWKANRMRVGGDKDTTDSCRTGEVFGINKRGWIESAKNQERGPEKVNRGSISGNIRFRKWKTQGGKVLANGREEGKKRSLGWGVRKCSSPMGGIR